MGCLHGLWQRYPPLAAMRRQYLPPTNFITVHYLYFTTLCFIASVVFYCSSSPRWSISYIDSLFLVTSAMTEAGLNTVNLSQMTTFQQVILWLLIILGSSIWVSIWTVLFRKRHFEKQFKDIARRATLRSQRSADRRYSVTDIPLAKRLKSLSRSKTAPFSEDPGTEYRGIHDAQKGSRGVPPISSPISVQKLREPVPGPDKHTPANTSELSSRDAAPAEEAARDHVAFVDPQNESPRATTTGHDLGTGLSRRHVLTSDDRDLEAGPLKHEMSHRQFLTAKKVGRNAQFHNLTNEERENLGGTEYRALKVLSVAVPIYFFTWQILGCVALGAWIATNKPEPAKTNAINPWWNGIFNGASAFNNSGMSVLDYNMIPYQDSYFVLVVMGAMVLAGNTAYPVFLRFWLWGILKLLDLLTYETSFQNLKETLEYILKYPRRVYTNLFPARATWWLLFMLFALNGTDWVAFEVLNLGNTLLEPLSFGTRIIDGLFQAIGTYSTSLKEKAVSNYT